jgi:hypothetical protein
MNQNTFDILEIAVLAIGCAINLITLIYLHIYTKKTYSIAKSTRRTAGQAAESAKITEESFKVSTKILDEMRETRDAQIAPYVFAYLDQGNDAEATKIYLMIKNAGRGVARNVRVSFDPELQNGGTYSLAHIRQLTNEIPALPPGGEIRHAFAFTIKYFNAEPSLPKQYNVRITYHGGLNKEERTVEQTISLDFFQGLRINKIERRVNN